MPKYDTELAIITFLNNQNDWASSSTVANNLDISVRSVKNYISSINDLYDNIVISSNKGYKIDKAKAKKLIQTNRGNNVPQNYEERKNFILTYTLMEDKKISISDLSDMLCISPVTLQKELSKIRADIAEYHLLVHIKNDILSISGTSKDKRSVIMNLINDEIKESYFSMDKIQTIFTNVRIIEIQKIVTSVLGRYEYFLDNYSLTNYCLHLALTIELRGNNEGYPESFNDNKLRELAPGHIAMIVEDIYEELKKKYDTNYQLYDIFQASVLMMTRVVSNNMEAITYDQLQQIVGSNIIEILEDIIVSVKESYRINLSNENFLIRFAFHLKNLLLRLENNITIANLQFDSIKNGYPLIYAVCVHISQIITKHCGYTLSEDEIAYIALHIGMLMEEDKAINDRVNTVLICSDYQGLGKRIFKKISSIFSESILVSEMRTILTPDMDLSKVDFIITTESLDQSLTIPHYQVNPLVSENDIKNIFAYIDEIKDTKIKNVIREKILYFFHEDLFFFNEPFKKADDAIEVICERMITQKYVEPEYKQQIYDHEKISSSSYGNIAIPHPLGVGATSSSIALSINPKPISWGINDVNLVFMLSLAEEDKELFSDIFNFINGILVDDEIYKKIMNCHCFDEFINLLVSNY